MRKISVMGFGFMCSIIFISWFGIVPNKVSLIFATLGAGFIIVDFLKTGLK